MDILGFIVGETVGGEVAFSRGHGSGIVTAHFTRDQTYILCSTYSIVQICFRLLAKLKILCLCL